MALITLSTGRSLISHPIVQNIAVLGSGTVLAQAVNIASTPILAFLYGPDSFGVMAIFMGIVLVVGTLSSLTYDSAIVMARKSAEAEALMALCSAIIAAVSACVLIGMAIAYFASRELGMAMSAILVFAAPLGVFFLGLFNAASNWMTRAEAFKDIAAANLVRSAGAAGAQIVLGLISGGGLSLVLGRVFGQIAATVYLLAKGRLFTRRYWLPRLSARRAVARLYYRFPVFKAPQSAIVLLADQVPALALGVFFGPSFAGLYWLADRILSLPCIVLSESTARVFYAEATKRYHRRDSLIPFLLKTIAMLAAIAIVPSILLAVWSPELLAILGNRWEPVAAYVQWMTLWAFFRFSLAPVMATYMILNDQKSLLIIDFVAMFFRLPCIVLVSVFGSPLMLVIALCLFESAKIIITFLHIILRLSSHDLKNGDTV